jgi:hypothetical protein
MNTINKIKAILFGAAIIASAPTATQATVIAPPSGVSTKATATVEATIPEFIILHYHSALSLNFATPESEIVNEGSNSMTVSWDGKTNGSRELAQGSLQNSVLELDGKETTVHIPNVWAIRGFSKNGKAKIAIAIPEDGNKLVNGKSEIGLSNAKVSSDYGTAESVDVPLNGIAKSNATVGGVDMDLNFNKTTLAGTHTGGQYTIIASTI